MAWDKRGFFYRSRRLANGRVGREYFGRGPLAEMAAHLMNQLRLARTVHDQKAARLDEADAQFRLFHDRLNRVAAAYLLTTGHYRHDRGPWRKRRGT